MTIERRSPAPHARSPQQSAACCNSVLAPLIYLRYTSYLFTNTSDIHLSFSLVPQIYIVPNHLYLDVHCNFKSPLIPQMYIVPPHNAHHPASVWISRYTSCRTRIHFTGAIHPSVLTPLRATSLRSPPTSLLEKLAAHFTTSKQAVVTPNHLPARRFRRLSARGGGGAGCHGHLCPPTGSFRWGRGVGARFAPALSRLPGRRLGEEGKTTHPPPLCRCVRRRGGRGDVTRCGGECELFVAPPHNPSSRGGGRGSRMRAGDVAEAAGDRGGEGCKQMERSLPRELEG